MTVPKFRLEDQYTLNEPLAQLGLAEMFQEGQVDFTCDPAVLRYMPPEMKGKSSHIVLLTPAMRDFLWQRWQGSPSRRFFHDFTLSLSSIAVDPSIIDENSELFIPSLPEPWDNLLFTANDIGPSIQGKHIDVFTGEGKVAQEETYSITGYENEVCSGN